LSHPTRGGTTGPRRCCIPLPLRQDCPRLPLSVTMPPVTWAAGHVTWAAGHATRVAGLAGQVTTVPTTFQPRVAWSRRNLRGSRSAFVMRSALALSSFDCVASAGARRLWERLPPHPACAGEGVGGEGRYLPTEGLVLGRGLKSTGMVLLIPRARSVGTMPSCVQP